MNDLRCRCRKLAFASAWLFLGILVAFGQERGAENPTGLSSDWRIQAANIAGEDGRAISSGGFDLKGWHPSAVPSTVLSALVKDGTYANIYFGTNLASVPTTPFTNAWWYRKEFEVSRQQAAGSADLDFDGINYRANIWLNGERIATATNVFGAYRTFEFNVDGRLRPGRNVLAVEVFPPQPGDFTMGFVDWNPKPPDRNMGLFRPVKLHFFDSVAVKNIFVKSDIDHATWRNASLTILADLVNRSTNAVATTVSGKIGDCAFSEKFALSAGETRSVKITPEDHPELRLNDARLWWPWELGEPFLYHLKLSATVGDVVSDRANVPFGIREVSDYINPDGYRGYVVNGRKLLIRGGGWADELLLDENPGNVRAQLAYTKAMNLNTIRLEGVWGSSQLLYDLADENGLLVMVGWSCQWEWSEYLGGKTDKKYGGLITGANMDLATNYLHDQVLWLRNHPSIYVWVLGSDMLPNPDLEKRYDSLLAVIDPTRPTLKSCGSVTSEVSGPSAVKMNGPYDYVTPNYWYLDKQNGGAFGFNTETGPGPQPPPLETLQRMFPADHLWPIDDDWAFHCGRGEFHGLQRYLAAFDHHYGESKSAAEFAFKSQAANYDAIRAMYEAFSANLPHTTGIIQWMLNASWPKLYWQLYDYYLTPGGAYFGAKKGAAPVAVIYNYGDHGIYLANQGTAALPGYQTTVEVYDLNSRKILGQTVTNAVPAGVSQKIFDLSPLVPGTPVYFVDLHGRDPSSPKSAADNFYWLSTKPDVLDEARSEWYVTPNKSYADFTSLSNLPAATVQSSVAFKTRRDGGEAEVTLDNASDTLAFFIEMKIVGAKTGQILTPVFWDDNYVSLPPHTRKVFHAHFPGGETPELKLQGWNVKFDNVSGGRIRFETR
jgi:exo-1,4-beta-D-glucosaminidase